MTLKSKKYLAIVFINLIILTGLLAYWTDFIELTFNNLVRPIEFLKIIGVSILSLIGIRVAIRFFRKNNTKIKNRIWISSLITFLISSFLYITYSSKIYQNQIKNRELRKELVKKIQASNGYPHGASANNLNFKEYQEISKVNWFPKLNKNSDSISFYYRYDGFLPDYSFGLSYSLPFDMEVDTTELKYGTIKIDTIGIVKRITYSEYED